VKSSSREEEGLDGMAYNDGIGERTKTWVSLVVNASKVDAAILEEKAHNNKRE